MSGKTKKKSASELLLAGITAIAESGIDKVTVSELTEISGVSRPTFYTYFGDIHGFFAEMWLHYGITWLNHQVGKGNLVALGIAGEVESRNFDDALLEIFVAARRIPELREVVEPDIAKWWQEQTAQKSGRELNLAWTLSVIIGEKLSRTVSKKASMALAFLHTFDIEDHWETNPRFADLKDTPKTSIELAPLDLEGETVESSLAAAAVAVIAGAGVASASLTRVARRARLSTGSVYPRFKNIEILIENSFARVMENLINANIQLAKRHGRTLESYGQFVNAGLLPGRKLWRNFRSEMHLNALHNQEIARIMAPAFTATAQQLQADIAREHVPEELAEAASWMMHDQAIGISVLYALLPRIAELDHRVMLLNLNKHLQK